jgi:hypothetical protein
MAITENKERIGNFTSSQMYRLMGGHYGLTPAQKKTLEKHATRESQSKTGDARALTPTMEEELKHLRELNNNPQLTGAPLTYIEEKRIERRMGRSIDIESYSRPMAWGLFMEMIVFSHVGMKYVIASQDSDYHPTIKGWSGSKDLIVPGESIGEIKCYQPKKFALYTDAILKKDVALLRSEFPEEYWQLVSNAIINDVPNAEAISFMPYLSELTDIRELAENYDGEDPWKYRFISESPDCELPYLPDGGYYKNLNRFEFEVPQEDRDALTIRVVESLKLLNDGK